MFENILVRIENQKNLRIYLKYMNQEFENFYIAVKAIQSNIVE